MYNVEKSVFDRVVWRRSAGLSVFIMYRYGRCLSCGDITCSTLCSLHADAQFSVPADLQLARTWRCALLRHHV